MLFSKQHNVCIYEEHDASRAHRIISIVAGVVYKNGHLVVPCTLHAMQTMAAFGYQAISPILNDYDWPSFKEKVPTPYEHQKHMASFITLFPRCFNLSDMGTGKTLAALWAYDYLIRIGEVDKVLIVAPLSTLKRVWEDEIFTNFLSTRRCNILYGTADKRMALLEESSHYYIINHDGITVGYKRDKTGLQLGELGKALASPDIQAVIVDEGSVLKDGQTLRYKMLMKVLKDKKYVTWMTGTPTPQAPTDAYAQARMVRRDYSETFIGFKERTMQRITDFKWIAKPDGYRLASEILQPAIRYSRNECLDLPEVTLETRECELSAEQKKAYEVLKKECRATFDTGVVTAVHEGALRQKLIQVACGAVYDSDHKVHKLECKERIRILREIIEEAGHKILIFAPLTSVVDMIYSELKQDYSVERINGKVAAAKRNEIFANFQSTENPRIIIADPRTMAHGLTLTVADTTVWYAPIDQAEIYQQANKRMDRPGQRNRMLIVRIAATSIEREMYKRLDARAGMQGLMLDIIKGE